MNPEFMRVRIVADSLEAILALILMYAFFRRFMGKSLQTNKYPENEKRERETSEKWKKAWCQCGVLMAIATAGTSLDQLERASAAGVRRCGCTSWVPTRSRHGRNGRETGARRARD